ncbi:MAG: hypothetical protein AAGA31_05580 [Bacteroidota bacterium]
MERAENETFLRTEAVLDRVILDQWEELDISFAEMKELLSDDSKFKFKPILRAFEIADKQIENYQKTLNAQIALTKRNPRQIAQSGDAYNLAYTALKNTIEAAKEIMIKHGKEFDLDEDEIKHKLKHYDKVTEAFSDELGKPITVKNWRQLAVERQIITASLLSNMHALLFDLNAIGCRRYIEFDTFFPVAISGFGELEKGDSRIMRFAIGSYSSTLDPENVDLRVNGERIMLGSDGTANYNYLARHKGESWLQTTCEVTDPRTGEVRTGEGQIRLNVR